MNMRADTATQSKSFDPVSWLESHWPLLLLLVAYVAIRSLFWNCQPIWDGAGFSEQLMRANQARFDFLNYTLDAHVGQGFFLFMSLPYWWFKHDYYRFNIWLTVFCALGLIAGYKILARFTNGRTGPVGLALGTALLAFHPTVLASMMHFTLDIGVAVFLLWYWLLLLEERPVAATVLKRRAPSMWMGTGPAASATASRRAVVHGAPDAAMCVFSILTSETSG